MEKKQQKYIRKIKLQLIQPKIKCSGRKDIICFYNGKIIEDTINWMRIDIKVYGETQSIIWSKEDNKCVTEGFEDLKIKE